ncbi:MAG: ribosome small subunit-dependent GTPase A [Anaerolineae bacterium]|nr:ribosome small subunit-dependent GTPase A [Anaerolineae bacterium]
MNTQTAHPTGAQMHDHLRPEHGETYRTGTVFRKSQGAYAVQVGDAIVTCALSALLRKHLVYPTADPNSIPRYEVVEVKDIRVVDPVAIGDEVAFITAAEDGRGLIKEVLPRRNRLARITSGRKPLEQVIVANVDQMLAVFAAAQPAPKWNLLDRYLVTAEAADIPAIICITKYDLVRDDDLERDLAVYEAAGYRVLRSSATTGAGIDAMRAALTGQRSVLVGKSGVGKTTLLNAIQPGLGLRVQAVNAVTTKGRHTTTHLEMFTLDGGGQVVDTPGMREFALLDVDYDLALLFPEMRPYVGQCKFSANCTHDSEPGCAIKAAVEAGTISARRYQSYLKLR